MESSKLMFHKEEKLDKLLKFKGSDKFKVTPDTTKAYVWLSEQMALKACKYKGLVPFKKLYKNTLFTTIDWFHKEKYQSFQDYRARQII